MRACAAILLAALLAVGVPQQAGGARGVPDSLEKPNVVLIVADDAGYADFGFQGSTQMQTPHLDRLAREGVAFTDAHVTASVCSPSRAGLMTGRYQQRFGYEANNPPADHGLDPGEVTLGEALQRQGYATAAFGKWHLGAAPRYHPFEQGFDEFYGILGGGRSYFPYPEGRDVSRDRAVMRGRKRVELDGYFTDAIGEQAVRFIEEYRRDEPFFAYVSFTAPHTPMQAKAEDLKRFQGHPRQTLAAMMWAMDRAVGRILKTLEQYGLDENTLVVFTNDNGGAHFNQSINDPLKGAKGSEFEGGTRVPFVLRWPGRLEGGRVYDGLVSTMDIFATAYESAGGSGSPGKPLDGVNLLPYLTGERAGVPHDRLFWRKEDHASARVGSWKLVRLNDYGAVLYNLKNDVGEVVDLKEEYPSSFERVQKQLQKWETELVTPRWHESDAWREVSWEIHRALMENRPPKRLKP